MIKRELLFFGICKLEIFNYQIEVALVLFFLVGINGDR